MKHCLLLCAAVLALAAGVPASAQSIFLDVNGDGVNNSSDALDNTRTSVDVYFDTNHDINGGLMTCSTGEDLTMFAYSVILRSSGGVTYGAYTDAVGFENDAGFATAGNDIFFGKFTLQPAKAPGKYKVGSLAITVTGTPTLSIVESTTADPTGKTSFGSACSGQDFDNTLKLPTDILPINVRGTASPTPVNQTTWGKIKALYR
jgi:hypothetical protein